MTNAQYPAWSVRLGWTANMQHAITLQCPDSTPCMAKHQLAAMLSIVGSLLHFAAARGAYLGRDIACLGPRRDLADAMGLERVDPDADPRAVDAPFALYDGSQFVLNQSDWTVLTMLRMGMRYGTAPLRFKGVPLAFFNRVQGRLRPAGLA